MAADDGQEDGQSFSDTMKGVSITRYCDHQYYVTRESVRVPINYQVL